MNVKQKANFGDMITCQAEYSRIIQPRFLVSTIWDWEFWRHGDLFHVEQTHNICTDEGLNDLLDIMFNGATQITDWFVIIFETETTPAAGTTYAVPVFTESSAYAEATRPAYVAAAASGKVVTNAASKAVFTMNDTKIIHGGGLVGGGSAEDTKANTAGGGTLYCASKLTAGKAVEAADVLKVTIAITAADA